MRAVGVDLAFGGFGFATAAFAVGATPRPPADAFWADTFPAGFLTDFLAAFFGVFLATFLAVFFGGFFAFLAAARFAPARGVFPAFFVFRFLMVFFAAFATRIPLQIK